MYIYNRFCLFFNESLYFFVFVKYLRTFQVKKLIKKMLYLLIGLYTYNLCLNKFKYCMKLL